MFTGIVEEIGIILSLEKNRIRIKCPSILIKIKCGDSIAVNGVCFTATNITNEYFEADISFETYKVTALSKLKAGDSVNLERALKLSDRLNGHIVTGHIDTVGKVVFVKKTGIFYELKIEFEKMFSKCVVRKGSIAVDGISLTISDCSENIVTIAIIPHTLTSTTLKNLTTGDNVNIEFDILAKYVEKFLLSNDNNSITMNFLERNGFAQ